MFQKLTGAVVGLLVLTLFVAVTPQAQATVVYVTYTGTLSAGYDQTGVFGSPGTSLSGDAFNLLFTFDSAKGYFYHDTAGGIIAEQLYGGSAYPISSPGKAVLTINDNSKTVNGDYFSLDRAFFDTVRHVTGTKQEVGDRARLSKPKP